MGRQPALTGIVLVLGPIEPPVGGVSRHCKSLVDLLRREGAGAVQLEPTRGPAGWAGLVERGIKKIAGRAIGAEMIPVARAVRRHRPCLVLDNQPPLWRDAAYARGTRLCIRVPYALAIHDGAFPGFVESLGDAARRRLASALERLSGVVCMSDPILEAVERIAAGARAHRLDPLVSPRSGPQGQVTGEPAAFFEAGGPVISVSGALDPLYGLEELLEAFAELRARGSRARMVVLLGSFARERATSAALAGARSRFGEKAILVLADFPDGPGLIARSDVYVRPSRVDSFGIALHEAMLAGVPVVAASHPTRPEGVLTYPPGDSGALARAIESALTPESRSDAAALAPRILAMVEGNRRRTLEVLAELANTGTGALSAPGDARVRAGCGPEGVR
jgi:glycosyltransferase involved in cell wall biosynthesis